MFNVILSCFPLKRSTYIGSYISANVLLNLLIFIYYSSFIKEIKCEACRALYDFFALRLKNSIIQEHEC